MPERRPFFKVTGVVEAPYQTVVDLLMNVRPGAVDRDNGFFLYNEEGPRLTLRGGPERFVAGLAGDPNGIHLDVDRGAKSLGVEGQWWFRGECRVEPHPKGARIIQMGFNIARTARWMVPLVRIGVAAEQRESAQGLLRRIGERLGARAYLE